MLSSVMATGITIDGNSGTDFSLLIGNGGAAAVGAGVDVSAESVCSPPALGFWALLLISMMKSSTR